MKFKLYENLSRRAANLIRAAGHDAVTVADQGLRAAADEGLAFKFSAGRGASSRQ